MNRSELFLDKRVLGGRVAQLILWVTTGLLVSVASAVAFYQSSEGVFLTTGFVLGIGMTLVPLGVKAGHIMFRQLGGQLSVFLSSDSENPSQVFFETMNSRLRRMKSIYTAGLAFGVLSIAGFYFGGVFDFVPAQSETNCLWLKCQLAGTIFIAGFVSGIGLHMLIVMGSIVWVLGRFKVKVVTHQFGVLTVGRTLLRIYTIAAAIWLVFSSSALVGIKDSLVPMASLSGVSLLVFLVSFPVCLLPLHERMLESKRERVIAAFGWLEELSTVPIKSRDDRHFRLQSEAMREYHEAQDLPEWPFGWRSLVTLVTSGFVSNFPVIIGFAFKYFGA